MAADFTDIICPVTSVRDWQLLKRYDVRPEGETDFGFSPYRRDLLISPSTCHVRNQHDMDMSSLYEGDYWDRTYGEGRISRIFDRIMALPEESSDNRGRVAFISDFCSKHPAKDKTVLDVGSGLAVFPAAMKMAGWTATALDPDPRSAAHAETRAEVEGLAADFIAESLDRRFHLVTFNKVLEHVPDPVAMLKKAYDVLEPGGLVYVELPDAEGALAGAGPDREEFFIEHYCAFSALSYAMLAQKAGFRIELLERLTEPSGKYTLRGFLRPAGAMG